MAKTTIVRFCLAAIVLVIPAVILILAGALAWVAHVEALGPGNTQGWLPDAYSQSLFQSVLLGAGFAVAALLTASSAWVGALVNARRLAAVRWYRALLWSGLASLLMAALTVLSIPFGGSAMLVSVSLFGIAALGAGMALLAYVVGGPDAIGTDLAGRAVSARTVVLPKATISAWFGWGWAPVGAGGLLALGVSALTDRGRVLDGQVWASCVLLGACFTMIALGALAETVAWWAALFNAYRLVDSTWFTVLPWAGIVASVFMPLFGTGALALLVGVAYLNGAPDAAIASRPPIPGSGPAVAAG